MTDTPPAQPKPRPAPRKRQPGESWTPGDIAKHFRVDTKTVARWLKKGIVPSFRTMGGHHRVLDADMQAYFAKEKGTKP